jgi:DNA-binding transcriptional MerR regulator
LLNAAVANSKGNTAKGALAQNLAPARMTMRIGELAQRTGRSVHSIRWYESIGLVPGVRRDAGNRRVYDERHVGWLDLMHRLRLTGMSIAKMREYAALAARGSATLEERRDLLAAHRIQVRALIDEWRRALSLLDRKLDFYGEWIHTGRRPRIPVSKSPPRRLRES